MSKAVKSMTPLWEDFIRLGPSASLGIRLPSGEVEMSFGLLSVLRLSSDAMPRTLDQWRELCHPADHSQMQELDRALSDRRRESLSLTRRLYCGDGVCRPFRLDACIQRGHDGSPRYLMGIETPLAEEPAEQTDGACTMPDTNASPEENLFLRHALQRQALQVLAQPPEAPRSQGKRSLAVLGLAGSGRSSLLRVLREDGFLPEGLTLTDSPDKGDIILYTIPIRGRLRAADTDLLNAAVRRGQKVIILMTMTDLERNEAEAGHVLLSRRQRVERALQDLSDDLNRTSVLPCPIVPVSSRLAWRGLYDRTSSDWLTSNFDALLQQIESSPSSSSFAMPVPDKREEGMESTPGLFDALLLSLREQTLRTRFLTLPVFEGMANGPRRVVLVGLNRQEELRLISRLAHDSTLFDEEAASRDWLFFGQGELPFSQGAIRCVRRSGVLENLDILAAPADAFNAGGMEWEALFARWIPVVHLDLVRVDSSLSELTRSPWFSALASAPQWVLAFAHGGLFDTRLPDLLEAEERVMRFAILRGFQGRMTPFVYENYDPRYTDFLELGAKVRFGSTASDLSALAAGWGQDEKDFAPPFTRDRLAFALLGIRSKLQKIRQQLAR
ncbi:MAG: PAS domain-containing protein [Fretibacterium sp.]|nr:PAS domain-containing protein [Fretibacterium sp.]